MYPLNNNIATIEIKHEIVEIIENKKLSFLYFLYFRYILWGVYSDRYKFASSKASAISKNRKDRMENII